MKINELGANSKVVNLVGEITHLEEPSETPNGAGFQEGIISDDTGQVKITFWENQVNQFKKGDNILISTGWCKSFENTLQVSSGKFGKITKVAPKVPE